MKIKFKKIIFILTSIGCLNFIILALFKYYILKSLSFANMLKVISFFGFCLIISMLEVLNKFTLGLKNKKNIPRLYLIISFFFFLMSLYLTFSNNGLIIKVVGFSGAIFFGLTTISYFLNLIKK